MFNQYTKQALINI